MKIAIIGAGNVGGALARSSVRAGHQVVISSSDPEEAQAVALASGARAASTNREALEGADVVIPAVYYTSIFEVLKELRNALDGKVVIDVTNPLKPDMSDLATEGTSAAEQIQERFPAARVAKAFNTAFAARQADPVVDGIQLDGFVAADDEEAKQKTLELVRSIGFRPIDAGPLSMARALEAMMFMLITLQVRHGWPWQNGWKIVGPTGAASANAEASAAA